MDRRRAARRGHRGGGGIPAIREAPRWLTGAAAIYGAAAITGWNGTDPASGRLLRWSALAAGTVAVSQLVKAIRDRDVRPLRFALLLLVVTVFTRAGHGGLGGVAASTHGVLLFVIAHCAFGACEHADLPAAYAGGGAPQRRWIAVLAVVAGSIAADAFLFAVLSAARTSLSGVALMAALGTLCTIAIAGMVAVLALRTPVR